MRASWWVPDPVTSVFRRDKMWPQSRSTWYPQKQEEAGRNPPSSGSVPPDALASDFWSPRLGECTSFVAGPSRWGLILTAPGVYSTQRPRCHWRGCPGAHQLVHSPLATNTSRA